LKFVISETVYDLPGVRATAAMTRRQRLSAAARYFAFSVAIFFGLCWLFIHWGNIDAAKYYHPTEEERRLDRARELCQEDGLIFDSNGEPRFPTEAENAECERWAVQFLRAQDADSKSEH
jgi:hypothetical protein